MRALSVLCLSALGAVALAAPASATLVSVTGCTAPAGCTITATPPNPVISNPNTDELLLWDEKQNVVLTADLAVDRVFDTGASFVELVGSTYYLKAGTIVSSHYVQWDPDGTGSVQATINADSQIFAFIFADSKLFATDELLGLDLDYNDFTNRGLEGSDDTFFSGASVDIDWTASAPGDWARMLTAYSPAAEETAVPVPAAAPLLIAGLAGLAALRRRR